MTENFVINFLHSVSMHITGLGTVQLFGFDFDTAKLLFGFTFIVIGAMKVYTMKSPKMKVTIEDTLETEPTIPIERSAPSRDELYQRIHNDFQDT